MTSPKSPLVPVGTANTQRGAALVVGLILLMVLTVLAISGMNTSTVELQMAGNMQYSQNAFQAAESGIEVTLAEPIRITTDPEEVLGEQIEVIEDSTDTYQVLVSCSADNGKTPAEGGTIGEFARYHADILSTGRSARAARAMHIQSGYVVAQDSGAC